MMTMMRTTWGMIVMWAIFDVSHARDGPPKLLSQPQQSMYYSAVSNSSIMLACRADGSTPIRLTWERDGIPVKFKVFGSGGGTFDLNHEIINPDQADEGEYICYVSNDFGHTISYPIRLIQAVLEDHAKQNVIIDEKAYQGDPHTLPCEIPHSVPEPEVYWEKLTTASSATPQSRIQYDQRIASDIFGNLHALYIENSDTGSYRCAIHNAILQKTTYGPIFNLQSTAGSQTTEPQLVWHSGEYPVGLHGSDVMITCIVGGRPLPQVEWYDDRGARMTQDKVTDYGRTLTLRNVRFTDARGYQCTVPGTSFTGGINFQLTVEKSPNWIRKPNPIRTRAGEQVSFNCSASGVPEPTITWYIDATPVADVSANKKPSRIENTQLTGSTTSILHYTTDVSFTVICEAANSHGYIWDGTYLYVDGPSAPTPAPTPGPTPAPTTAQPAAKSSNSAAIGGSIGGVVAVVAAIVVLACIWSRRRNRKQPETKSNVTMAYRNRGFNDAEQPTASGGKGESYSGLSIVRDKAPQGNVYDELDAATSGARAINKNEEAEYCYISDSDIKEAQRQSKVPIPSVRNNKSTSESGPGPSSVGYNASSGKKLSHFPSGKYSAMNDPVYQGQTGNQDPPTSPEYLEPKNHEYFVLEPEHTSL